MSYPLIEKERFIELRLDGLSYSKIATMTGISKTTLLAWGKELNSRITKLEYEKVIDVVEAYTQNRQQQLEQILVALNSVAREIEGRELNRLSLKSLLDFQKYLERRKQNILMDYDSAITQEIADKNNNDSSQTTQPATEI